MGLIKQRKQTEKVIEASKHYLEELITLAANKHNIPFENVAAIIWQESKGNPLAHRYEDEFYQRYLESKSREQLLGHVPAHIPTLATEKRDRAYSWGLMQVMGQTARENGFKEDNLPALLDIEKNLETGCAFISKLVTKYNNNWDAVYKAYNGSSSYGGLIEQHIERKTYSVMFK